MQGKIKRRTLGTILMAVVLFVGTPLASHGQPFSTVINVPPSPAPTFVNSDTQLNILPGAIVQKLIQAGSLSPNSKNIQVNVSGGYFNEQLIAERGTTVNVTGGVFEGPLGILSTRAGTVLNFQGGHAARVIVGSNGANSIIGPSIANFSGGSAFATLFAGAIANVSDGDFYVTSYGGSEVNVTGGRLILAAVDGGEASVRGGTFRIGGFIAGTGGHVDLYGGDFLLDDTPVSGAVVVPDGSVLTGTFQDGSPFIFTSLSGDKIAPGSLTLNSTSLPPASPQNFLIDELFEPAPAGVRAGQTLTVRGLGGVNWNFTAVDATLIVDGGFVEDFAEVARSNVYLNSGYVGEFFTAFAGSTVTIRGGMVDDGFRAFAGSSVNIVGQDFKLVDPTTGAIVVDLTPSLTPFVSQVINERNLDLVARLADGSYFDLKRALADQVGDNATLTITLVPEPASRWLFAVAMAGWCLRRPAARTCGAVRNIDVGCVPRHLHA